MVQKFRVLDTVNKCMSEIQAIVYVEEKVYPIYSEVVRRYIPFSEAIFMKSTGLFDSSEPPKEIFDGDIVKLHHFITRYDEYGGAYEDEEEIIGVIHYGYNEVELKYYGKVYPPKWFIETKNCSYTLESIGGIHEESFTVLGNIHQHQHLLENLK